MIAALLLAAIIPGGQLGTPGDKDTLTVQHMQAIEDATRAFMAANERRPCPADGTLAVSSANFGIEAANAGGCTSGTPAANFNNAIAATGTSTNGSAIVTSMNTTTHILAGQLITGTNIPAGTRVYSVDSASQITMSANATGANGGLTFSYLVAGTVPTRTLGLSEETGFDGYGRRMMYEVDTRATSPQTCYDMRHSRAFSTIGIYSSTAASTPLDRVIWSLISYGKDGHGAFSMEGTSIANRINASSSDNDELNNVSLRPTPSFH